jgi:hypothetical protein
LVCIPAAVDILFGVDAAFVDFLIPLALIGCVLGSGGRSRRSSENDKLIWPHCAGLIWPHPGWVSW